MIDWKRRYLFAVCDAPGCGAAIGRDGKLRILKLVRRMRDEGWRIESGIYTGRVYCPKHANLEQEKD